MTQLSDVQLIILSKAAKHPDRLALPLPTHLNGGAIKSAVVSLIKRGLLEEVDAKVCTGETVWRETGFGPSVTLSITQEGLAAICVESERATKSKEAARPAADKTPTKVRKEETKSGKGKPGVATSTKKSPRATTLSVATPRKGTKRAAMIEMLQRKDGATIAEICEKTGWQRHTVRGAFAGLLKKKLGLDIVSEKVGGRGRVYRTGQYVVRSEG
jgi:hypothetical protein